MIGVDKVKDTWLVFSRLSPSTRTQISTVKARTDHEALWAARRQHPEWKYPLEVARAPCD